MIPSRYEYLSILIIFQFLLSTLFWPKLLSLAKKPAFWNGLALALLFGAALELVALSKGWWRFNSWKIMGLQIAGIPLEEFLLMGQVYAALIAAWESFADELE